MFSIKKKEHYMPQNPTFKIYIAKCIMLFKGGTLALPGPTIWMGEPRLELVPHKPRQNFQAVQHSIISAFTLQDQPQLE